MNKFDLSLSACLMSGHTIQTAWLYDVFFNNNKKEAALSLAVFFHQKLALYWHLCKGHDKSRYSKFIFKRKQAMVNFQRIFGDDGLPYLIDTSSERTGENYSSWNLGNENLELSLEPFARDRDMDPGYEPDTARFREFQTSYPELMRCMDRPEDFLRSNFLRTEKENYQDGDFDHCNFNASRNQIGNARP